MMGNSSHCVKEEEVEVLHEDNVLPFNGRKELSNSI
jgi:hypothetical protein